jgi:hypothetical protein
MFGYKDCASKLVTKPIPIQNRAVGCLAINCLFSCENKILFMLDLVNSLYLNKQPKIFHVIKRVA